MRLLLGMLRKVSLEVSSWLGRTVSGVGGSNKGTALKDFGQNWDFNITIKESNLSAFRSCKVQTREENTYKIDLFTQRTIKNPKEERWQGLPHRAVFMESQRIELLIDLFNSCDRNIVWIRHSPSVLLQPFRPHSLQAIFITWTPPLASWHCISAENLQNNNAFKLSVRQVHFEVLNPRWIDMALEAYSIITAYCNLP